MLDEFVADFAASDEWRGNVDLRQRPDRAMSRSPALRGSTAATGQQKSVQAHIGANLNRLPMIPINELSGERGYVIHDDVIHDDVIQRSRHDSPTNLEETTMRTLLVAAVLAIGMATVSTPGVSALPVNAAALEDAVSANSLVSTAHYRPYYHRHHYRYGHYHPRRHCWWGPYGRRCRWW